MPIQSRNTIEIPGVSLPSYVFNSPEAPDPEGKLYIDVDRPDTQYLTVRTYRQWAQRLAAGLRARGLQKGDRVLLFSGTTMFFPVVIMGVVMAGGIFTGANPGYVARELAYQIKDSGARFVISSEVSLDTAKKACEEVGLPDNCLFTFDGGQETFEGRGKDHGSIRHWTSLLASPSEGEKFQWDELTPEEAKDTVVALNYSSGTTGVPKGVMITHTNYIANCAQVRFTASLSPDFGTRHDNARWLCFLPMYHAMAQMIFAMLAPCMGTPTYIMRAFDFYKMLECIQKFKISELSMVPPIAVRLSKDPKVKEYDLSSVERAGSGAAPLGRDTAAQVEKLFTSGNVNFKQGWGMTEVTCACLGWDPRKTSTSAAVGELQPNCQAILALDDDGKEAGPGERGELWIKGPNVMKGYWRKPDATKNTFSKDGWLKTGDIALIDDEGHFCIVDRKKELIKVKGAQVAPAELEALLLEHPAVADAAVIGLTINEDGEEWPCAYIVAQPDAVRKDGTVDTAAIDKWMRERTHRSKWLVGGIEVVEAVPKNPSGKILRNQLREKAKRDGKGKVQAKL